jgi:hypothetical protein
MISDFTQLASKYDQNSLPQLIWALETIYENTSALQDDAAVLALYTNVTCQVAVYIRRHSGLDLRGVNTSLEFPIDRTLLNPDIHILVRALRVLEYLIRDGLDHLEDDTNDLSQMDADTKLLQLLREAKMRAAFVWKGYLLALNTPPNLWGPIAEYSFSTLRILAVVSADAVIKAVRKDAIPSIPRHLVQDDDWPPRKYIDLYSEMTFAELKHVAQEHWPRDPRERPEHKSDYEDADNENKILLSAQATVMARSVKVGQWQSVGSAMTRVYEFANQPPLEMTGVLRIECWVSRHPTGVIGTNLCFYLKPYLYLRPSRRPFADDLRSAAFSVGLVAAGSGAGTEASPLLQGGLVQVSVSSAGETPDTAFLLVNTKEDVTRCIQAISSGNELTFTLVDYETEPPVKFRLQLPNDRRFSRLYNRIRRAM